MIAKMLDDLREKFPACKTLVYADLGTQMALVNSSAHTVGREILNDLCAQASSVLGPSDQPVLGARPCMTAITANQDATLIFLRTASHPDEALCCICDRVIDLQEFLPSAQYCLTTIVSEAA